MKYSFYWFNFPMLSKHCNIMRSDPGCTHSKKCNSIRIYTWCYVWACLNQEHLIYYGLLMFDEATNQNATYVCLYCLVSWNNSASWDLFSTMTQGCLLHTMLNRSHYQVKSHVYFVFRHIYLALFLFSAKIMVFMLFSFFLRTEHSTYSFCDYTKHVNI